MSKQTPEQKLRACVAYCREQNGMDECKNCGIDDEMITSLISQVEKEVIEKILEGQPVLPPESKEYSQGWVDCNEEWLDLLQAIKGVKEEE